MGIHWEMDKTCLVRVCSAEGGRSEIMRLYHFKIIKKCFATCIYSRKGFVAWGAENNSQLVVDLHLDV